MKLKQNSMLKVKSLYSRICCLFQNWEYPRKNLVYLKELGEGEFGKVLLMKAQVSLSISVQHVT